MIDTRVIDMTIDEVIQRENKIVEENQKIVDTEIVFDGVSLSQLYCDDIEVIEEHLENYKKCTEYHKQIAEWLEELKDYRDKNKMVVRVDAENMDSIKDKIEELSRYAENQYNKAIDDFVKAIVDRGLSSNDDKYCITSYDNYLKVIKEIAEQLKEGGENE